MGVGIKSSFGDVGLEMEAQVNTDAGVAMSISSRPGAMRVRHVEVRKLWVQEKVRRGRLSIIKVKGEDNMDDGLTKHAHRSKLETYMNECGFTFRDGRRELWLAHWI